MKPNQTHISNICRLISLVCLWLVFFNAPNPASAQGVSATASAPKNEFLIGDKIDITLDIKMPENYRSEWKRQDPENGKLELRDSIKTDSLPENHLRHIVIHLPMAGFDSGMVTYPEQVFIIRKPGSTVGDTVKTKPLNFHIITISVDTKKDIKPIAEPVEAGLDWIRVLQYILLCLIIAGIVIGIYLYLRNRKREKEQIDLHPVVMRPPWETAIEKLAELQKADLPAAGDVKGYYISLSGIVRQFISDYYKIDALEITTDELMAILKTRYISKDNILLASDILTLSDSVKFAKYIPEASDHEKAMNSSLNFVSSNREEESRPAEAQPV